MKISRSLKIAALSLTLATALVGCGGSVSGSTNSDGAAVEKESPFKTPDSTYLTEGAETLKDGRVVTCIAYEGPSTSHQAGGVSCDWANAAKPGTKPAK